MATRGWFELEPVTSYTGLRRRVRQGNTTEEIDLPQRDHFALEIDHFSECVMKELLTPGEARRRWMAGCEDYDGDLRNSQVSNSGSQLMMAMRLSVIIPPLNERFVSVRMRRKKSAM